MIKKSSRYTAYFFAFLFLCFTAVQYNDPDKSLWIFIYLMAFSVSLSAAYGSYNPGILLVMAAASLFGAFEMFPYGHFEGVALKHGMKTIEIELARESFGFAIIAISSLYYLFLALKK
jgi:transmembrane protein TMEM220